jgi:hypothetical protein
MAPQRGVYFLANDHVLERVIAFLNSFRAYNPTMPLCLIPFADDIDGVLWHQRRYDFSVWSGDPALLRRCDDISLLFHDEVRGHYRKLVAWEGEFDEFVYVDTDTVVLGDVGFVFDFLDQFGFVVTSSEHPDMFRWVWQSSIHEAGALTPQQIGYCAGTQFIASRRESLRFADASRRLPDAVRLAPHMALVTLEMPLLNYLIVTSGYPHTSLRVLGGAQGRGQVPPGPIPQERHATDPFEVRDGQVVTPGSPPTFVVHWAGLWWELERGELDRLPREDLWGYYRHLHRDADQVVGRP